MTKDDTTRRRRPPFIIKDKWKLTLNHLFSYITNTNQQQDIITLPTIIDTNKCNNSDTESGYISPSSSSSNSSISSSSSSKSSKSCSSPPISLTPPPPLIPITKQTLHHHKSLPSYFQPKQINDLLPKSLVNIRSNFSPSSTQLITPCLVGPQHFLKIRLLGKGDVGKVFLVRRKGTNNLYAMKVLSKTEMLKRNKIDRVNAEHEILTTSNHPFLARLYHTFQTQRNIYFCLEYCLGGEFFRALQTRPGRCLDEYEARFYVAEVVLALEYLHLQGFIYRDLKPENILLHASGHIKLTDFDLSKRATDTLSSSKAFETPYLGAKQGGRNDSVLPDTDAFVRHYRTNSFVGTEEYISPEVIEGQGHSATVDWWCLGILTYELIYGYTPFKSKNRNMTFMNVLSKDVTFPITRNAVSMNARSFMRKLLIKNEHHRLGSNRGAQDIKSHAWLKSVPWPLLRNLTPPILFSQEKWAGVLEYLADDALLVSELNEQQKCCDTNVDIDGECGSHSADPELFHFLSNQNSFCLRQFQKDVFNPADVGLGPSVSQKDPECLGYSRSCENQPSNIQADGGPPILPPFLKIPALSMDHELIHHQGPTGLFNTGPSPGTRPSGLRQVHETRTARLSELLAEFPTHHQDNVLPPMANALLQSPTTTYLSSSSSGRRVVDPDPFLRFTSMSLIHGDDPLDERMSGHVHHHMRVSMQGRAHTVPRNVP